MDLHDQIQKSRKEHREILRFLNTWDAELVRAASESDEHRRTALCRLRQLLGILRLIRIHCQEEEEKITRPFRVFLDEKSLDRLDSEHQILLQLIIAYEKEVSAAESDVRCAGLAGLGRVVIQQIRTHVAFEEKLLQQIESKVAVEQEAYLAYSESVE